MNNFRNDVLFYLGKNTIRETEDFDDEDEGNASKKTRCPECGKSNCSCKMSRSTETAGGDDGDDGFSYYTKKKSKKHKNSTSTETGGGDDDDDGYTYYSKNRRRSSADTEDFDDEDEPTAKRKNYLSGKPTPEEKEMLDMFKKKSKDDGEKKKYTNKMTDKQKEMLRLLKKKSSVNSLPGKFNEVKQNKGASENCNKLPDDHTNGRNGSCKTSSLKESIEYYTKGIL